MYLNSETFKKDIRDAITERIYKNRNLVFNYMMKEEVTCFSISIADGEFSYYITFKYENEQVTQIISMHEMRSNKEPRGIGEMANSFESKFIKQMQSLFSIKMGETK